MTYMEQRLVIARLHIDLRLRLDAVVHDERQRVTVTKGRNSPVRAIRERRINLGFPGHFNIIAKLVPQIRKAKVMRRWKDGEHIAGIPPQHDCLGQTIPRNPTRLGGPRGSPGGVMRDHIVLDVFRSQVSLEWGSYGHDGPPLRLTSPASLALTAPGEERSREICGIAMSFRRARLFLWRV